MADLKSWITLNLFKIDVTLTEDYTFTLLCPSFFFLRYL